MCGASKKLDQEADEADALGVAPDRADLRGRGADDHPRLGDEHHIVPLVAQADPDHLTVALGAANVDHALTTTTLDRIVL